MSRNYHVGAAVYGGSTIIPLDARNPNNIAAGSLVGLDNEGNLKASAPYIGVLTAVNTDGSCSVGTSGIFNAVGVSGAIGTKVASSDIIIMSAPFSGWAVDAEGKKSAVQNIVTVRI